MADILHDDILDLGLTQLTTDVENLYICSAQPTTFLEASNTYKLGTKATPSITGPTDGDSSGRKVVIAAITDGTVDATGNAAWFALCDNSSSKLLVSANLASAQDVTLGNPFTLTETDITIPDPTT